MALSIKNPEAGRLARALAEKTGETITEAVIKALRERLQRETERRSAQRLQEELLAIGDRCASLPDLDHRAPDQILGFDDHGVPRS